MNDTDATEDQEQPASSHERKARSFDRDPSRRLHQGPRTYAPHRLRPTYDRSRPNRSKRQKSACHGGPSTYEGAVEKGAWAHRTAFDRRASSKRRRHRERLVERETHLPRHALRQGKKNGQWNEPEKEVVYLIARFPNGEASPKRSCAPIAAIGHRDHASNKDVILGEDGYTNRSDEAPRNIFSLIGFALKILNPSRPLQPEQSNSSRTTGTRPCACSPRDPRLY